jgi:hypothetical protein
VYNNAEYGPFPSKFKSAAGTPAIFEAIDDMTFSLTFDSPSGGILRDLAIIGWASYNDIIKPEHYLAEDHPAYADADALSDALEAEGLAAEDWPTLMNNAD